jgi:tRNA (guanine9-N1)-methyltransferase
LMNENEIVSLSQQISRSYSGVRNNRYRPKLLISGVSGRLRNRFDGVMHGQYRSWKGVKMVDEGIMNAATLALSWMNETDHDTKTNLPDHISSVKQEAGPTKTSEGKANPPLVYITAESQNVLSTLSMNTSYVIGGLVDKNRHKGYCHSMATAAGLETARLPIDDYVKLSARKVLTTNHVVEIMLKYLETGDWAESFLHVIPSRTGVEKLEESGKHVDSATLDGQDKDNDAQREKDSVANFVPSSSASV